MFSILPDGYEPDLKIEVTGNGTPTKIDPDTVPPKNATAHETFTVGGNVARLTVRRLPADAGKPAIAEEATIEMIYGTKSIELTLDFPIAARDYYLALFKAFAQSLKPTNTDTDLAAASLAEESIPQKPAKDGATKKEKLTGGIQNSTKANNGEETLSDYEEDMKQSSIRDGITTEVGQKKRMV